MRNPSARQAHRLKRILVLQHAKLNSLVREKLAPTLDDYLAFYLSIAPARSPAS